MNQQKQPEQPLNFDPSEKIRGKDPDNNNYDRSRFDRDKFKELNTWANIDDQYMFQPIYGGDGRVLVELDGFKSRYECTACHGKGHTDVKCGRCNGTKLYFDGVANSPCTACAVGELGGVKRYGYQLCEQCKGRQGTIIIPDMSQKSSDSGTVLAVSHEGIKCLKPNMKVLIATYSGVPFGFLDHNFKIMVEKDILGILKQLKSSVDGMHQGTYADLENSGVAHE